MTTVRIRAIARMSSALWTCCKKIANLACFLRYSCPNRYSSGAGQFRRDALSGAGRAPGQYACQRQDIHELHGQNSLSENPHQQNHERLPESALAGSMEHFAAAVDPVCAVAAAKCFVRGYCRPVHLTREPERPRLDLRPLLQMG